MYRWSRLGHKYHRDGSNCFIAKWNEVLCEKRPQWLEACKVCILNV